MIGRHRFGGDVKNLADCRRVLGRQHHRPHQIQHVAVGKTDQPRVWYQCWPALCQTQKHRHFAVGQIIVRPVNCGGANHRVGEAGARPTRRQQPFDSRFMAAVFGRAGAGGGQRFRPRESAIAHLIGGNGADKLIPAAAPVQQI